MRPLLPSLIMIAYVYFSLVRGLPWRPAFKRLATLLLLVGGLKYIFYVFASDSFPVPDVPSWLLQSMEVLYAAILLLFVLLVIRDVATLLLRYIRPAPSTRQSHFSRNAVGGGLVALALCLALWGTWEATRVPDVRTQEILIPDLPAALDGLVIVQLSDIHIGPLQGESWLGGVVDKTNAQHPDIVVITGDIVDGSLDVLEQRVAPLANLQAKFGVYGVTGNHEYYFNTPEWLPAFARLGIRMLANEHHTLTVNEATLVIAGVNDTSAPNFGGAAPDSGQALKDAPEAVRILLSHRADGTVNNAHLQLSGHTHGGMMLFMQPLVAVLNGGFVSGLYPFDHGQIYVSPGTGVGNGFACRMGVPSEITRLVLRASTHTKQL